MTDDKIKGELWNEITGRMLGKKEDNFDVGGFIEYLLSHYLVIPKESAEVVGIDKELNECSFDIKVNDNRHCYLTRKECCQSDRLYNCKNSKIIIVKGE